MAILTDSMTGSEFKAAINTAFEDCVSKSYTGEQTLTGSLSNLNINGEIVSGSLKIGDITIGNKNDYLKNVIEGINSLWANEIVATDLAAGNISFFKDIMYLTENTYIEGNKWYRENNNSKTVVQLQQGNIEINFHRSVVNVLKTNQTNLNFRLSIKSLFSNTRHLIFSPITIYRRRNNNRLFIPLVTLCHLYLAIIQLRRNNVITYIHSILVLHIKIIRLANNRKCCEHKKQENRFNV